MSNSNKLLLIANFLFTDSMRLAISRGEFAPKNDDDLKIRVISRTEMSSKIKRTKNYLP